MRAAPPLAQWFIWLCILALISAAVGAIDYFGYGFATHFKGVPGNIREFVGDPGLMIEAFSSFPQFGLTFVMLWIFCVVLIHLIWPAEITATLRWAALTYVVGGGLTLAAAKISSRLDDAFDEARISNLLNGPDLRASSDTVNGGPDTIDTKTATAWRLTERPGVKPTPGELSAVSEFLASHRDPSAIKMEKIYRAYFVSPEIIRLLVNHSRTPPLVWSTLAESAANRLGVFYYPRNDDLIAAIARDPRTQPELLLCLLQMPEMKLEPEVMANPKITDELKQIYNTVILPLNHADPQTRLTTARDSATPPYLLYGLSWENDTSIRLAVASNPATPLYTLQRLAYDKDPQIKQAARATLLSKPLVPAK